MCGRARVCGYVCVCFENIETSFTNLSKYSDVLGVNGEAMLNLGARVGFLSPFLCAIDIERSCLKTPSISRSHGDLPWRLAESGVADAGVTDAVKVMLRRSTFPFLGAVGSDRKALSRGEWAGMGDE